MSPSAIADGARLAPLSLPLEPLPAFEPRWPWRGGDLQTLKNFIFGSKRPFPGQAARTLHFPMNDGTGDQMVGLLDQPRQRRPRTPLVVALHGVTGVADSYYMRLLSRYLTAKGVRVLRLNQRGAGQSMGLCRVLYHGGKTDDICRVLDQLQGEAARDGVLLVGFSMGGNVALKWAGEQGSRPSVVRAVLSVSPPLRIRDASQSLSERRNQVYEQALLRDARKEVRAIRDVDPELVARAEGAKTVLEWDQQVSAWRTGHPSAEALYDAYSSLALLPDIRIPSVILHAEDDPWIPPHAHHEAATLRNEAVQVVMTQAGGHVGFHMAGRDEPYYALLAWEMIRGLLGPVVQPSEQSPNGGRLVQRWRTRLTG